MINHRGHRRIALQTVAAISILIIVVTSVTPLSHLIAGSITIDFVLSSLSYATSNLLRYIFILQFVLVCAFVCARFVAFNEYLESFSGALNSKDLQKEASKLCRTFHSLCDVIDTINATFTFPLVFVIANILLAWVFNIYGGISNLRKFEDSSMTVGILNLSAITSHVIYISLIVGTGSCLTKKAEKIKTTVSRMIEEVENYQQSLELVGMLTHFRTRGLNVKNDIFVINWSVLKKVRTSTFFGLLNETVFRSFQ